jgi:hypothetical protein
MACSGWGTGSAYGVAWDTGQEAVSFGTITRAGVVTQKYLLQIDLGLAAPGVTGTSKHVGLAWSGAGFGLAWGTSFAAAQAGYFAELGPAGEEPPKPVNFGGAVTPSLAWNGQAYAAAYLGPPLDVYAATITCR